MKLYSKFIAYLIVATAVSTASAGSYEDFFRAVNVDNAGLVKDLLARGFDPNSASEKGQTGLYLALRDGSPKVAEALMADPRTLIDAPNASDETPLMMAALRGQLELATRLLDRGAKLNRPGWTPLHYAATGPETPVVAMLLTRGAEIESRSPNDTTPLMMAARYGHEDSVNLLLAKGASLQARNDQGLNAADFARLGGRERLAARLAAATR
jgi:uncharacterized protein